MRVEMVGAWVLFPALIVAVCLGMGLLVARVFGWGVPGLLLAPVGFAGLVVATQLLTAVPVLTWWALPVVTVLALTGFTLGRRGRAPYRSPDWAVVAAALAVFVSFSLPVVATGTSTFAGWMKLDDGATWLAFADRLAEAGRSLRGLAPSSYERVLALNWPWYPLGAFAPLGVLARLVPVDVAWLLTPFMAVVAGLTSLVVAHVLAACGSPRWVSVTGAFIAPQAALLYGFGLWGGLKELIIVLLTFSLVTLAVADAGLRAERSLAPVLGIVVAAMIAVAGPAGLLAAGLVVLWWVVLLVRTHPPGWGWRIAWLAAVSMVCAAPTLGLFASGGVGDLWVFARADDDIGPLAGPLSPWSVVGIWPTGDFRSAPDHMPVVIGVGLAVVVLAGIGVAVSLARRRWGVPVLASSAMAVLVLGWLGNPWLGAKALAMASPVVLTAAFAGIGFLRARPRGVAVSVAATAMLAVGVLWSNVMAYGAAWLAPSDQLAELQSIGSRFAGQGPALLLEYSPYGVRHFLRTMDAEGANELRSRPVPLASGRMLEKAEPADIDELHVNGIADYRTLVLRRSGLASRPSGEFELAWAGEYYEVWQRRPVPLGVVAHMPMGSETDPSAIPDCTQIAELAALTPQGGHLLAVPRPAAIRIDLDGPRTPAGWAADPSSPGAVVPAGPGDVHARVDVPDTGEYTFWVQGSFRRGLGLNVDGLTIARSTHRLNWPGNPTELGTVNLVPGPHTITLHYGGSPFAPGANGPAFSFGPLFMTRQTATDSYPQAVPVSDYKRLCAAPLDWVESVTDR